jgi:outer membrane protein TolC
LLSASGCCVAQVISLQPSSPNLSSNEGAAAPPDAAPTHNATQVVTQSAPETITLQDAIARAQRIYGPYIAATTDAQVAREDFRQARNAMLPSIGYTQQYLGTQANGKTPNGRYVTNDGVHVYRAWGSSIRTSRPDSSPRLLTSERTPWPRLRMRKPKSLDVAWSLP